MVHKTLRHRVLGSIICLLILITCASCGKIIDDTAWLDSLHEQGRQIGIGINLETAGFKVGARTQEGIFMDEAVILTIGHKRHEFQNNRFGGFEQGI